MNNINFSPGFFLNFIAEPNPSSVSRPRTICCDISINSMHTQSTQLREYYFHSFFNCSWMSRPPPRVINFNPDAPIELQKATPPTLAPPRVSAKVPAVHKTDAAAAKVVPSQGLSQKPWKNIAITEYDDAEFEELQARMVFTWPPDLAAYRREVEEKGSGEVAEYVDENIVPEAFYGASPTGSGSTDSSMILTPTQQDYDAQTAHVPLAIHLEALAEPEARVGALEKVVGLQRLRRKAPPPLSLRSNTKQVINEIGRTLLIGDDDSTARETRMLSPLTAAMKITSKLSAGLLRNIHIFPDELLF
ncbi:uncharacterized protein EDB93DRAFT_813039 [Suillus bovinus]|uniref:uncharacterized protein n=1 Tax=Suillus bovinus TaxID=48563 RepID=UPI001B881947|nr:uncharacterized protein EDB93DRAFT_813039 [Suillus bovinus]KAG2157756.1 hypothetical protein EDB93DRAFT_813039 [Suillus bovinus]